jgi:hypothetical protein
MRVMSFIGSAGRGSDAARLNENVYEAMYAEALDCVRRFDIEIACSGGAAFADHIAVSLFLRGAVGGLSLYLPAVYENGAYVPNARVHANPGRTANDYHRAFRASCGIDGLSEIAAAISRGAYVETYAGFKRRNLEVAGRCSHMLAFTFGNAPSQDFPPGHPGFSDAAEAGLKDGGTAHTWGECWKASWKRHVNLFEFQDMPNAA